MTEDEFPDAHKLSQEILIMPVHQSLTRSQLNHVATAIETLTEGAPR